MNMRQNFYWHIFIQWLSSNDLLEEYVNEWEYASQAWSPYGHEQYIRELFKPAEGVTAHDVWPTLDHGDRRMINVFRTVERISNRRDIAYRFHPPIPYRTVEKVDNPYHHWSWSKVCHEFATMCIYDTPIQRTSLSTIKRAWAKSGATFVP